MKALNQNNIMALMINLLQMMSVIVTRTQSIYHITANISAMMEIQSKNEQKKENAL